MPDIIAICRDTSIGAKSSNGSTWTDNTLPNTSSITQTWKFINSNGTNCCYGLIDSKYQLSNLFNGSTNSGTSWTSAVLPILAKTTVVALYPGATQLAYSYDGTSFS